MARFVEIVVAFHFLVGLAHAKTRNILEFSSLDMCPKDFSSADREDCVCYPLTFAEKFSEYLYLTPQDRVNAIQAVLDKIADFRCEEFMHLPEYLEAVIPDSFPVSSERKKRLKIRRMVHRRVKRQVSLGIPTDDKWEVIIPQLPHDGGHHYVPIGSYLAMKCITSNDKDVGVQDQIFGSSFTYDWKHDNGMEITAPYTNVDQNTGDLVFHRVRLEDTSIYNCTMTSEADFEENKKSMSYLSQLDVIAGPTYWLRFGMTFEAGGCRHKELVVLQQKVHEWVHEWACHFCPVMNVSLTCTNYGGTRTGEHEKFVQLRFSISVLGFEELLASWSHNHINCNMECQKRMHAKVLSEVSKSLFKLFSLRIDMLSNGAPNSEYKPVPNSRDEELVNACPPGFFLSYSLCFPCAPGAYSPTGPAECFPCVKGAFQPNPGSSACFNCPEGKTTRRIGSQTQADCILETPAEWIDSVSNIFSDYLVYFIIGGCVGGVVLFLWILVCWCWPRSGLGKILTCAACCGEPQDEGTINKFPEDRRRLNYSSGSEFDSDRGNPRPYRKADFSDDDDFDVGYR